MTTTRCVELNQPMLLTQTGPEGLARKLLRIVTTGVDLVLAWQERATERSHLATLDDRLLRDIGLSRSDVEREVSQPFWR